MDSFVLTDQPAPQTKPFTTIAVKRKLAPDQSPLVSTFKPTPPKTARPSNAENSEPATTPSKIPTCIKTPVKFSVAQKSPLSPSSNNRTPNANSAKKRRLFEGVKSDLPKPLPIDPSSKSTTFCFIHFKFNFN